MLDVHSSAIQGPCDVIPACPDVDVSIRNRAQSWNRHHMQLIDGDTVNIGLTNDENLLVCSLIFHFCN